MKLFPGVAVSIAVALAFGIYLTHRAGGPPVPATIADEEANHSTVFAGDVRRGDTHQEEIATLRNEVMLLRREVSALAAAGSARGADMHQAEMAALREEITLLGRKVSSGQGPSPEARRSARVVALERAEAPDEDRRTDPAAHAEAERKRQEQMAILEADFWQEDAASERSSETAMAVQEALASDDTVQVGLRSLECRVHTCRLEIADDTGELAKSLPLFLQQLAQTLPNVTANQVDYSDGSRSMILYMTGEANEAPPHGK